MTALRKPRIILASASPRRRELLESLGLSFDIVQPLADEKSLDVTGLNPREKAIALARFKGGSVAELHPERLIIAADTLVVTPEEILEKPAGPEEAFEMLSKLQGRVHSVYSAIALFYQGESLADALETHVFMRSLSPDEIRSYIQTGEPLDKAGAYAIQGYGSLLIERIEGCYFNVVGMSLVLLDRLCKQMGIMLVF